MAAAAGVRRLIGACAVGLLLAAPAQAELRNLASLRWRTNRPGFGLFNDLGWRHGLYGADPPLLLRGCFIEGGVVMQLSPASLHPGAYVTAVPIAPILLRASVQRLAFFGNFGMIAAFDSPQSDWSVDVLRDRAAEDGQFSGGWTAELRAQLRLKVKRWVLLHEQRATWFRADDEVVEAGEGWYEPINDLLLARTDWLHIMKTTTGALAAGDLSREFLLLALHWERYAALRAGTRRDIVGLVGLGRPSVRWPGAPTFGLLLGLMPVDAHRSGAPYIGGFVNWVLSVGATDGGAPATP